MRALILNDDFSPDNFALEWIQSREQMNENSISTSFFTQLNFIEYTYTSSKY